PVSASAAVSTGLLYAPFCWGTRDHLLTAGPPTGDRTGRGYPQNLARRGADGLCPHRLVARLTTARWHIRSADVGAGARAGHSRCVTRGLPLSPSKSQPCLLLEAGL